MPATTEILRAVKAERKPKTPKPDLCRWVSRPVPDADRPDAWQGTIIINDDFYQLRRSVAQADDDRAFEIFDVIKLTDKTHHRLTRDADGTLQCDCEWSTYRPEEKACRHRRAIPALLAWLEARERDEWEAKCAADAAGEPDEGSAF